MWFRLSILLPPSTFRNGRGLFIYQPALLYENITFNYILVHELNFVYLHIDIYEIGFNFEGTLFYLDISIDAFEKTEYINDIAL